MNMNRQILTKAAASTGLLARSGAFLSNSPAILSTTLSRRSMYSTSRPLWTDVDPIKGAANKETNKFEAAKKLSDEMDRSAAKLKDTLDEATRATNEPIEEVAKDTEKELTEEEKKARREQAEKLAEQAAASEKLWNILVVGCDKELDMDKEDTRIVIAGS
ncbi:hypothetical protein FOL47_007735 [Perkinsus chesapeaki]|uniref:Uncharacterized protein n=1 Tax=Perkinsus chesapeaki TaxID=330153 RepID=A0A7J6LIE1_PERCH|nr:hypothetical protein FOL47_007735 [Perkinsus chesapeaki]